MTVAIIRIYPANWVTGAAAVEQGLLACTHRGWWLRATGTFESTPFDEYWWHTQNDGSTSPGVDSGDDPRTYDAALSSSTGFVVALAAGYVSAATRATAVAAALEARGWCDSATVAGADNADGSRSITVVGTFTTLAVGTRGWASRGAAGVWGSHQFRRGLGTAGTLDTAITRNLAQRITPPSSTARVYAVSMVLGGVVSTTAANIPRLYLRVGGTTTDPAGSTLLYDFGQLPVSQVQAGRRAYIHLTAAQVVALRAALDTVGASNLWLCVKAGATTQNTSLPVGAGWQGELADASLRVDVVTSGAGNTAAPASWNSTGMQSPGAILAVALHYDTNPASNGESYPAWGAHPGTDLTSATNYPNAVVLPNSKTAQTGQMGGHRGAHVDRVEASINSGTVRYAVFGGGDVTTDLDDPTLAGATTLFDSGSFTATNGLNTITLPTGDSSVICPDVLSVWFWGQGASGDGAVSPRAAIPPTRPNDWILAIGTADDGTAQHELDYGSESGSASSAMTSPVPSSPSPAPTTPDNVPALRVILRRMADTVQYVAVAAAAAVLLVPSAAAVGARVDLGSASISLPVPAPSASGRRAEVGAIATSLPLPIVASSGLVGAANTGTVAAVLPVPVASAAGRRVDTGSISCSLPLPSVAASSASPVSLTDESLVTADTGFAFYVTRRPT